MPKKKHVEGWWMISIPMANKRKIKIGPMSKPRAIAWLKNNGFSRKGKGWCMRDENQLGLSYDGKIVEIALGVNVTFSPAISANTVSTCETYLIRGRRANRSPVKAKK